MESLVQEGFQLNTVADEATFVVQTGNLRPRIEGEQGALRSAAYDSIVVDSGLVRFDVRPYSLLDQCKAVLYVRRYSLYGESDNASFLAAYPDWQKEVSGELYLNRGMFTLPIAFDGVVKVWLEVTNYVGTSQTFASRVMVFGKTRPQYVEAEFEGRSPNSAL